MKSLNLWIAFVKITVMLYSNYYDWKKYKFNLTEINLVN
jgi:hypothetical protein